MFRFLWQHFYQRVAVLRERGGAGFRGHGNDEQVQFPLTDSNLVIKLVCNQLQITVQFVEVILGKSVKGPGPTLAAFIDPCPNKAQDDEGQRVHTFPGALMMARNAS